MLQKERAERERRAREAQGDDSSWAKEQITRRSKIGGSCQTILSCRLSSAFTFYKCKGSPLESNCGGEDTGRVIVKIILIDPRTGELNRVTLATCGYLNVIKLKTQFLIHTDYFSSA